MNFDAIDRATTHSVKWESRVSKFGSDDLLPLWVADMDIASPPCVVETIQNRAKHPIFGYTIYPDRYYSVIVEWMKNNFGWEIDREWIVPSYGVVPSINFSIEAYTQIGDGIIIQTPVYPPFFNSVTNHRRKLLTNKLLYIDGKYKIDFDDFEAKAKDAKLFILCSPHNPVGRVWSREELERLASICRDNSVTIVSDEIHSDLVYEKRHTIMASISPKESIILNAPSKTFNIAGLNTSFAIIPDRRLRSKYSKEQRRAGFGDGNPFGIEALISAYSGADHWLKELKDHLQNNIIYVNKFIKKFQLDIIPVDTEATFLIWLDCSRLGLSDNELEEFFIKEAKLGLNSGISFGDGGEGFMRLNIATSLDMIKEAMDRLLIAYNRR